MDNKYLIAIDIIYKFASVATLIFLTWQIKETKQANKMANIQFENKKQEDNIRHQKDEREKAIQLAEMYANELIGNIAYLSKVYKKCGILQYFKDIPYSEFKNFDIYELEQFIRGKTNLEELLSLIKNIDLMTLVDSMSFSCQDTKKLSMEKIEILSLKAYINKYEEEMAAEKEVAPTMIINNADGNSEKLEHATEYNEEEEKYHDAKMMYRTHEICYKNEFNTITYDTLNKLEYFCMYFNSGVADEETVYQSLHQSFLDMVKVVYFRIASKNETGKDKYYTNIVKLYNKWSERYSECLRKEIESNRSITHMQECIKK